MPQNHTPTFNLLSIGHRGVGKSVFLAGSYTESQAERRSQSQGIWFEGSSNASQRILDDLLSHMRQTGQYPSPTMKITDFTFSVRSRGLRQDKVVCNFRWSDIPGEICRLDNFEFEIMLLQSHGCCVFIDAAALVHDPQYLDQLGDTIKQIEVISSLAVQSEVNYFFALILTKCDQLHTGSVQRSAIEQKWQALTTRLLTANAVYRRFNSAVTIVPAGKNYAIQTKGAAAPFLWLATELGKVYQTHGLQNLNQPLEPLLANTQPAVPDRSKSLLLKGTAVLVAIGAVMGLWLGIRQLLPDSDSPAVSDSSAVSESPAVQDSASEATQAPSDDAQKAVELQKLVNLHKERGQYEVAINHVDQLISLQPDNLDIYLQKASIYSLMGRMEQEEAVYDQILAKQNDHMRALTNKAILRSTRGDQEGARALFDRAEKLAPTADLKQTIRELADTWLNPSNL